MKCVTVIACLLAVSGCGSEEKPKPPPAPTDGLELVQPGAEPRRQLRYQLASGTTSPIELAMDVDLKTADQEAKLPTMAMSLDIAVAAVDAGTAKLKLSVAAAGARPRTEDPKEAPARTVMNRQANLLAGMVVTFGLTPQGGVKDSKVEAVGRDLSGPMQEQVTTLVQTSEQLAMPLPEQPVGVGAIWKHRRTMKQNQLTLVTMTTVEVTAIDGDRVTFKSSTEMTGADQTITQGSASAQVTAIRGTGTQTGTFDLTKAVVFGESKATLGFEMIADGQRRPMKLDIATRITERELGK
jgi:hypothetical protein